MDVDKSFLSLREEFFWAKAKRKQQIIKEYRELLGRTNIKDWLSIRVRQLASYDPFDVASSSSFFDPKFMFGLEGFDIVIGNPPYVQLQKMSWTQIQKDYEAQKYQSFTKMGDLYCLFYERGNQLLNHWWILCYITSNKRMRAWYGEKMRQYLLDHTAPLQLIDFWWVKVFESATVDTNILMFARGAQPLSLHATAIGSDYRLEDDLKSYITTKSVRLTTLTAGSWFIGNTAELSLKTKIESIGKPLKNWDINIYRGILTGLNEAFIITESKKNEIIWLDPKSSEIIKPILRGRDIKKYGYEFAGLYVIGTFPALHLDIDDYPGVKQHLLDFGKDRIEQTWNTLSDWTKSRKKTWNKRFETQDQIWYHEEFEKEKIVYPNMAYWLMSIYDDEWFYVNQKCFMITGKHLKYIQWLFNSKILNYLFKQVWATLWWAWYEMSKIFIEKLLVAIPTPSQESAIITLVDQILTLKKSDPTSDTTVLETQIDQLVYELYGLTEDEVKIVEGE